MRNWLFLLLLWPALLFAQSPFDGTWVVQVDSIQLPKHPEVYSLKNEVYECSNCVPKIKVKADGEDHPVPGSPYFHTIAVKVIDSSNLEITEKRDGKTVYSETDTVSPDGDTLTQKIVDSAGAKGQPMSAEEIFQRVGTAAAGERLICGSWQPQKFTNMSTDALTVTYHIDGDAIQSSNPDGEGYNAKFDGKQYPIQGSPTPATVSLKKIDSHSIEEVDREAGVVHYVVRMSVSADGESMTITETDNERGTTVTYAMKKKS